MGDCGNQAERTLLAKGTCGHIQTKHPSQEPHPVPIWGSCLRLIIVHSLLAWCGNDRVAKLAMGRQTAAVAKKVGTWQGHKGGQLLQQFQRREFDAGGAVGPRSGKPVHQVPMVIFRKPLKRYRASSGIANQTLQLIPPMGFAVFNEVTDFGPIVCKNPAYDSAQKINGSEINGLSPAMHSP